MAAKNISKHAVWNETGVRLCFCNNDPEWTETPQENFHRHIVAVKSPRSLPPLTSPSRCDRCLQLSQTIAGLERCISNLYQIRDEEILLDSLVMVGPTPTVPAELKLLEMWSQDILLIPYLTVKLILQILENSQSISWKWLFSTQTYFTWFCPCLRKIPNLWYF